MWKERPAAVGLLQKGHSLGSPLSRLLRTLHVLFVAYGSADSSARAAPGGDALAIQTSLASSPSPTASASGSDLWSSSYRVGRDVHHTPRLYPWSRFQMNKMQGSVYPGPPTHWQLVVVKEDSEYAQPETADAGWTKA
jgi:hypothetical protein